MEASESFVSSTGGEILYGPRPGFSYRSVLPGSMESRSLSVGSTAVSKGFSRPQRVTRLNRVALEAKSELESVYDQVGHVSQISEDSRSGTLSHFMSRRSINLNNPKLGSVEEFQKDIWQEAAEKFARKRGRRPGVRLTLQDKRNLRRWFSDLDADGSGEVTIDELEDPLISTGILKTKEEVLGCMREWDTDGSNTISFDEFVDALHESGVVDRDRLQLLQDLSNNKAVGMETLIGIERRKTLSGYVVGRSVQRQGEVADLWKKEQKLRRQGAGRLCPEIQEALTDLEEQHMLKMERDIDCVRSVEDVFQQRCADMRARGLFHAPSKAQRDAEVRAERERKEKQTADDRRSEAWDKSYSVYSAANSSEDGWNDRYGLQQSTLPYSVYADKKDVTPSRYVVPKEKVPYFRKTNLTYKTQIS